MPESLGGGARGLTPYRTRAGCLPAANFNPASVIQPLPTWFLVGPSAELSTTTTGMPRIQNQYPVLTYDIPSSVSHSGTQVHRDGLPQAPAHWGEEQSYTFFPSQGIDLHATGQTLHQSTCSLATTSLNNYGCHLTSQMAPRPPQSPPQDPSTFYRTTVLFSQPPAPAMSLEDALHIIAPSTRKETGPSEISPATDTCPFPECQRRFTRPQETERHALRHLPRFLLCNRPGCGWAGSRRYALRDHLKKKHLSVLLSEQEFILYDAKRLVKQLLNKEITVEQAECEARSSF